MKRVIHSIFIMYAVIVCLFSGIWGWDKNPFLTFPAVTVYAAQSEPEYAYLYFYTIDGEEIEELEKRIRTKKEYVFADPNEYKYLPYEDENGNLIYNEFNDQVTGIYWEEETDRGDLGQYNAGDRKTFSAGDHFFRVKSDNPALTGENLLDTPSSEYVHLSFFTPGRNEIEDLAIDLTKEDEYTFKDPDEYTAPEESEFNGKGIYWACTDDRNKHYLFKNGDKCKFKPGDYEFHVVTDDPVTVSFYYPLDFETYFATDNTPGEKYADLTAKVGDTITLKKSLGAILWESTFKGWEETNFESESDKVFSGGNTYRIMDNVDLDFFAVYEQDENWDPEAIDENVGAGELDQSADKEDIIVDIEQINSAAGAGYGAYIDSSGKLKRVGGTHQINSKVKLKGIRGEIKEQKWLSSMIDSAGDPNDPENYNKDKYGNKTEDSKLPKEINNVLRQDDSAMYMDVYGNSFVYNSQLSRANNMNLALERLTDAKTDSWAKNVQNWDEEVIHRFEAIEFALLKGKYPADGEDLFADLSPEVTHGAKLIWKNEYMSEKAFKEVLIYKTMWNGWYDTYDDGLEEKYKALQGSGGGGITTISSLLPENLFEITAYAAKNGMGESNQVGSRIITSSDTKDVTFKPQYYDPNKYYSTSAYSFGSLSGLNEEQKAILSRIFTQLTKYGFSEEAAAGACGNLWAESDFKLDAQSPGGYLGMVQWGQGRATKLKQIANEMGSNWQDVDVQIAMIEYELNSSYLKQMNNYLKKHYQVSGGMSAVNDVETAAETWAVVFEGCTCVNNGTTHSAHNSLCSYAANGKSYQHLIRRKNYAQLVYDAMVKRSGGSGQGGSFIGLSNAEILSQIFGMSSKSEIQSRYSKPQLHSKFAKNVEYTDSKGKKRSIEVNKYIADDVQNALNEISASGFYLDSSTYGWRYGDNTSGGGYSFHNLGLAIDINCTSSGGKWDHNPQFYIANVSEAWIKQNYRPGVDPLAVTLNEYYILKSHGLLWGRDFEKRPDLMHFTVGEVGRDGAHAYISEICEGKGS